MHTALFLIFLTGAYPMWRAGCANSQKPLLSAIGWAALAWAAWTGVSLTTGAGDAWNWLRYLALCLTCCAGVAVLGARQPGATDWNGVVLGLLAILLLPLAEQLLVGADSLGWVRSVFFIATLAFILVNYLPTCFAPAVLLFGLAAGGELMLVQNPVLDEFLELPSLFGLAIVPWVAFLSWRLRPLPVAEFDRRWRDFRNRYGMVWAARLREQFNHAAANAAFPVHLSWQGLRPVEGAMMPGVQADMLQTLEALLKRFG